MPPLAEPLNQALEGAYGSYFFGFVVIEDGWASGVVYNTASREREEQEGARGHTMSKRHRYSAQARPNRLPPAQYSRVIR